MSPLVRTVRLRCSPSHAFETFTARIDLWWPPGHRRFEDSHIAFECRLGGRLYERAPTGEEHDLGRIRAWEPPHRLAYSWWPAAVGGPTHVEIRFLAEGEQTLVEVTHGPGESTAWNETVGRFEAGWARVLPLYAAFAEGRVDAR